jgi:hypothetical protein
MSLILGRLESSCTGASLARPEPLTELINSMLTKALPFDEDETLPVEVSYQLHVLRFKLIKQKRIKARFTQPADTALLRQLKVSDLCKCSDLSIDEGLTRRYRLYRSPTRQRPN